jgi:hypothetical protein
MAGRFVRGGACGHSRCSALEAPTPEGGWIRNHRTLVGYRASTDRAWLEAGGRGKQCGVQDEIVFRFLEEEVAASARLLREAPETCRAVLDGLPTSGLARHGIYSGSEVYLVLPVLLAPPREHATTIVGPGDVGFLTVEKGSGYGIEQDYSEVCWFYDLDATPSMPEGPVAVNVFARLYDADAFFAVCRRMRLEGAKKLEIACA